MYIDVGKLLSFIRFDAPRYSKFAWVRLPNESYVIELQNKKEKESKVWLKLQLDKETGNYQVILDVPGKQGQLIWSTDPNQEKNPDSALEDSKIKAFIMADEYIIDNFSERIHLLLLDAGWRDEPTSDKQISFLSRFIKKSNLPDDLTKGEAFLLINLVSYLLYVQKK